MMVLKRVFISFIIAFLYIPIAMAQSTEMEKDIEDISAPEILSYASLCKAIYWQRVGDLNSPNSKDFRENYQNARDQLMLATRFDPKSSFLYTKLTEVLFSLRDRRVESVCRKALELNPDNANAHYWLGRLKYGQRRNEEAIREFKVAAELDPEHLDAQRSLGVLLYNDEDFAGAARAYSEVVKIIPYDPRYRIQLGYSYAQIGEIEEAIKEYNAAIRLGNSDLEPHFHLSYLYARQSRNKEAIEKCLFVLKYAPGDERTTVLLGELYVATGEFDKAIDLLKRFVRRGRVKKKWRGDAYYRLATAYKSKGDAKLADSNFQQSIEIYSELLDEDPKEDKENIDIRYSLAMVYDAKGDLPRAEQYLREYIKLDPDKPDVYNYLGYMLVQNDIKLEEATDLIEKAVEKEPENGAFRDSLGWAYFKLGNLDEAIAELEKAAELIPYDSEIREHLGEAYLEKGGEFTTKAITQWEKALEIKPNNAMLQQRLEELSKSLE